MDSSNLDASKGGKARAKSLTKEERSEIARRAANARWDANALATIPKETHPGTIRIGTTEPTELQCGVLDNSIRVFSTRGVTRAMGGRQTGTPRGGKEGAPQLPPFLASEAIKPFISPQLMARLLTPLQYRPKHGGRTAFGYEATLLPEICELILDANEAKPFRPNQQHLVAKATLLIRGFARVGIIALVDEATGYQYDRPRKDLEEYLKKFLSEGLRRWVRTFPGDYFKHLCRLKGVELRTDMKLPQYFGHITNDLIWRRIAPGLLKALKERREERGRRSNKIHQWTSEELGKPELLLHLGMVVGLMKVNTDYEAFHKQLDQIAPVFPESPTLFDDPKDWEIPK